MSALSGLTHVSFCLCCHWLKGIWVQLVHYAGTSFCMSIPYSEKNLSHTLKPKWMAGPLPLFLHLHTRRNNKTGDTSAAMVIIAQSLNNLFQDLHQKPQILKLTYETMSGSCSFVKETLDQLRPPLGGGYTHCRERYTDYTEIENYSHTNACPWTVGELQEWELNNLLITRW